MIVTPPPQRLKVQCVVVPGTYVCSLALEMTLAGEVAFYGEETEVGTTQTGHQSRLASLQMKEGCINIAAPDASLGWGGEGMLSSSWLEQCASGRPSRTAWNLAAL